MSGYDENQAAASALGCFIMLVIIGVLTIVLGGVWRTEVAWSVPQPAGVEGKDVTLEQSTGASHWLVGLVKGKQPDVKDLLGKLMQPGDQVKEVSVVTRHSWTDNLVTGVTLGIYAPVTVDVKMTVVRK